MRECPKCKGQMTVGVAYCVAEGYRIPVQWVDGEPRKSLVTGLALGGKKPHSIRAYRCGKCGFIETYGMPRTTPDEASARLESENEQLKQQMAKLVDRIAVLERIVTDPAERTAREIESLRTTPAIEDQRGDR